MYEYCIVGKPALDIETPALLLDIGAVERNIEKMAAFFRGKECGLRPHFKTHKLPMIARKQIAAGAIGITCAKIHEAEVLVESGIEGILIANEVVPEAKIRRLVTLARYSEMIVCVDSLENANDLSRAAGDVGVQLSILVEVNAGLNRCGVSPGKPALELAQAVHALDNLRFRGVMGYEGGVFVDDPAEKARICEASNSRLVGTAETLRRSGLSVEIVSAGGSNTYRETGLHQGITEVQVGAYVTMDAFNRRYGIDFEQAISVLATVISTPEPHRAVIDTGKKSISTDMGLPVIAEPGLELFALNEEHGHIGLDGSGRYLRVGDKIVITPSHGCTTIPLHDEYVIVRDGLIEGIAPIRCRASS
jgi:D-serine deaminase-like pyridoxal phosphate-dependent protein